MSDPATTQRLAPVLASGSVSAPSSRADVRTGVTSKNSPTSAIISPTMKVVPRITICSLASGHADRETGIESVGSAENPVTRIPKKTQLISR